MFRLILATAIAAAPANAAKEPRQILNCRMGGEKEVSTVASGHIVKATDGSYDIVGDDHRVGNFKPGAFDSCLLIEAPSTASA